MFTFVMALAFPALPASAQGTDCVLYATDYANARMGSGDVMGDAVSGGMEGAVVGGAWRGQSGARRGAEAGGALGVLDNLGSLPGGWQALYDMAYQICLQQNSPARGGYGASPDGAAGGCRSSATINKPMQKSPDGSLMVGSGGRNCQ
ncbi:hypothetical protein GCM10009077_30330 [Roseibium denhamense]